ncbi:hypothetical protein DMUE_4797 [Dictyocoela muelleri]|nr:hypothetical protein DMUE_4797 [Dictyocoela muelleri]
MLNYKCKSHRCRSPQNRTDTLCIFECISCIQREYVFIIPEKKMKTAIPIINNVVSPGSITWTDEHRSDFRLSDNFIHQKAVLSKRVHMNPKGGHWRFQREGIGVSEEQMQIFYAVNCIFYRGRIFKGGAI